MTIRTELHPWEKATIGPPHPGDFGIPKEHWEKAQYYANFWHENRMAAQRQPTSRDAVTVAAPNASNELVEMAARLADSELRANQLEAQFHAQCKITAAALEERAKMAAPSTSAADMFWDSDNNEKQKSSIGEILDDEASNGCLRVGAEFQIMCAVRLPDVCVKVTAVPEDGEIEYVVIKGGA